MTHPLRQIRILAVWQVVIGAGLTAVFARFGGPARAASFASGAALALANLLALAWGWWRVLGQKPVAWTVVIIVSKYAVLLSSTYYLSRTVWFDSVPAGLGIASFTLPALVLAFFYQERESIGG